ncbi:MULTISPECIES: efflux transporter outer membrane subunit [Ramlibacter]|uniref:Efflux transporter outer membrane subunit n=1 Tax=Ramlibacter pinisoli TaxID=2682844 RepID=A0A6N8J169_9BURK|nr:MULTISPECIES: efflux transporter outer membrane subunit [Ramlibacter]MBA2962067.1 efflux transporter outer membrane subunit [Ramlibacter sp. CGMCC 1.13660]MVQ32010.1 efflux transporter outer membrane subunit [Ramlibacter pinisoli]
MRQTILLSGFCAALLCGCADVRITEYQRPEAPDKPSWSRPSGTTPVSAADTISTQWWTEFRDPYLDSLVARAIAGSFDLKILAARIDVANLQIAEAGAGGKPTVDIGAGANIEKSTGQRTSKQYSVGAQVNWDIDVWGKYAKGVQAQTAEFNATEADWRAGYLTLASSVSTTYFQIRLFDEQLEDQQRALTRSQQILAIFETMRSNGLVPTTQVQRQRAETARLTKDLLELRRLRDVSENALATLVGVPAGQLKVPVGRLQDRVQLPTVPTGLPSQLLARRPDIVAAEFRVLAAHDLMGQAKLEQLPSIGLTGRGGSASFALSDLLKSFTFGLAPSINIPALNPGIKARAKTSEAQVKVAEQEYRRTVIAAFEDAENALVNLDAHRQQREQLQLQVKELRQVGASSTTQLAAGLISQLEVFENERSLLAAELALLASHQQVLSDTVTLYKALGGGWAPVEVANARR